PFQKVKSQKRKAKSASEKHLFGLYKKHGQNAVMCILPCYYNHKVEKMTIIWNYLQYTLF
ncbi:MAG: hypothetical protein IKT63_04660, partial [Oscillospiraceae bacterium]|nr:hypothetical protein [Oscillospiraceae bacterium]